jgi:hypothetical protein
LTSSDAAEFYEGLKLMKDAPIFQESRQEMLARHTAPTEDEVQ